MFIVPGPGVEFSSDAESSPSARFPSIAWRTTVSQGRGAPSGRMQMPYRIQPESSGAGRNSSPGSAFHSRSSQSRHRRASSRGIRLPTNRGEIISRAPNGAGTAGQYQSVEAPTPASCPKAAVTDGTRLASIQARGTIPLDAHEANSSWPRFSEPGSAFRFRGGPSASAGVVGCMGSFGPAVHGSEFIPHIPFVSVRAQAGAEAVGSKPRIPPTRQRGAMESVPCFHFRGERAPRSWVADPLADPSSMAESGRGGKPAASDTTPLRPGRPSIRLDRQFLVYAEPPPL